MNACPHCQQTYEDWVEFCFEDGTPLVSRNGTRPLIVEAAHPDSTVPSGPLPGRASAAAARSLVAFEDDADDDPTVPAVHPNRDVSRIATEEVSLADAPTVELPNPPRERAAPDGAMPRVVAPVAPTPTASGTPAAPPPRRVPPAVTRAAGTPEAASSPSPATPSSPSAVPTAMNAPRPTTPVAVAAATVVILAAVLVWALTPSSAEDPADVPPSTTSAGAGDAVAVLAAPSAPAAPAPQEDPDGSGTAERRRAARRDGASDRSGQGSAGVVSDDSWGSASNGEVGNLIITSKPDGATVTVDGKPAGTTPVEHDVPYGSHTVRVSLDGYKPETRDVGIHVRKLPLPFTLQPKTRTGIVKLSAPGAARVLVDGNDVGVLPARFTLNEGSHEFQVVGVDPRGSCTKRMDVAMAGSEDVALTVRCP
jgi:hypothetical protein